MFIINNMNNSLKPQFDYEKSVVKQWQLGSLECS